MSQAKHQQQSIANNTWIYITIKNHNIYKKTVITTITCQRNHKCRQAHRSKHGGGCAIQSLLSTSRLFDRTTWESGRRVNRPRSSSAPWVSGGVCFVSLTPSAPSLNTPFLKPNIVLLYPPSPPVRIPDLPHLAWTTDRQMGAENAGAPVPPSHWVTVNEGVTLP